MSSSAPQKDPTFRNYDSSSAKFYAKNRPGYPEKVIDIIINQHTSTGGKLDLLVDIGCGPGTATRSVAPHFQHAIGADPGQSMIETARSIPSTTKSGEPVTYEVCSANALSTLSALKRFPEHPVDLITAATSAHWFEYPDFYREAAKILKPGGSIIIWAPKGYYVDERTTPNAKKMQELWQHFEDEVLAPYELEGNKLNKELLAGLPLPWSSYEDQDVDAETRELLKEFDQERFARLVFNENGRVGPGEEFLLARRATLEQSKATLDTVSPVTRWREANKEKVERGEIEDCVEQVLRQTRELMDEDPEMKGRDWIEGGSALVILVIKKKA